MLAKGGRRGCLPGTCTPDRWGCCRGVTKEESDNRTSTEHSVRHESQCVTCCELLVALHFQIGWDSGVRVGRRSLSGCHSFPNLQLRMDASAASLQP